MINHQKILSRRFIFFLTTLPALFFLTYFCHLIWAFTVDDAFIEFRYVENFVQTGSIAWNIGFLPTEACTSFAHLMLLSLLNFVAISPVVASKLVGIGSIALIYYIILRQITDDKSTAILWGLLFDFFAMNPATPAHMISGLETTLYLCLIFMLCMSYTTLSSQRPRFLTFSLLSLLSGLTRPESNAFLLALLCITPFFLPSNQKRKFILYEIIFYLLPAILYFIWRVWYFQLLLPLPFYTKVTGSKLAGAATTIDFIKQTYPFFMASFCLLYFSFKKNILIPIGFLIILVTMFLFAINVKPIMAFEYRYLYPVTAVLLAFGYCLTQQSTRTKGLLIKIFSICLMVYCIIQLPSTSKRMQFFLDYAASEKNIYGYLGKRLAQLNPTNNFTVISDAGILPYYSKLPTLDYWSLTDAHIASENMNEQQIAHYIFSTITPTIVIVLSQENEKENSFVTKKDEAIYIMAKEKDYCVFDILQNMNKEYLWVMVPRKKLTEFEKINPHKKMLMKHACFSNGD
ncbi:MAG: hypothetical protein V4496_05020 [Pseudomonadota bacterium]